MKHFLAIESLKPALTKLSGETGHPRKKSLFTSVFPSRYTRV